MPALALTDEGSLGGAVPFYRRAPDFGVRPILGAILDGPDGQAVCLVESAAGYRNLCELLTARNLAPGFSIAGSLPGRQEGLLVLTPSAGLLAALAGRLDRGRLWAELLRPAAGPRTEAALVAAARAAGAGLVASTDAFFAGPDDFETHVLLQAMKETGLLAEVRPRLELRREAWLRTPAEMSRLFADRPEALANTVRLAEHCRFDLLGLEPVFPKLPGDSPARLREEAFAGARRRGGGSVPAAVAARLDRELSLIAGKGFADYFLIVADIVRHARSLGTPVAGRGSGASSLVAYLLGITNVDPLEFNLPFERFLNESRDDFPDLDIDFCWRLRDEVIAHVFRTHGVEHAAMVSTLATLQPRAAFRETGGALGLSGPALTVIERQLRHGLPCDRWDTLPAEPAAVERLLALARRIEGFPHHRSVHCGGVVIAPDRMAGHAPLLRAAKGVIVTEFDKDGVEAVGLVKLDLLGNRSLSTMGEALRLSGAGLAPDALPAEDGAAAELLVSGRTVGVGQLESPAMRHLLRQMRPRNARDLMKALALIRPGAASLGMKESFVRRARGEEPVPPGDPRLAGTLDDTFGVMLYEDDVLMVASALTGLPPAEADRFRRAVTKCRSDRDRLELSAGFLSRCRAAGVGRELAADLWVQMAKFNAYSFCRAHAASYARLSWANAWLKAHRPLEFWVAALNNNAGMYPHWVYVEEAKREGIRFLLPCVNRSGREFQPEGGAVRVGLGRVRSLSAAAVEGILAARPFAGLADFLLRSGAAPAEAAALVRCGALDFTGHPRPGMLLELHTSFPRERRGGGEPLLRFSGTATGLPALGDYSPQQRRRDEWRLLELCTGAHPLAGRRPALAALGAVTSGRLPGAIGESVRLAGVVATGRTVRTESGGPMCFLTLSDEDGVFEATIFPPLYRSARRMLAGAGLGPLLLDGVVESQHDAISVTVRRVGRAPA